MQLKEKYKERQSNEIAVVRKRMVEFKNTIGIYRILSFTFNAEMKFIEVIASKDAFLGMLFPTIARLCIIWQ